MSSVLESRASGGMSHPEYPQSIMAEDLDGGMCLVPEALSEDAQRQLMYARTTLATVDPLAPEDEVALRRFIPQSAVLTLLNERDAARGVVDQRGAALEAAAERVGMLDASGDITMSRGRLAAVSAEMEALNQAQDELTVLQRMAESALADLGTTEADLRREIEEDFPDLFLRRAEQIALQVLADNRALAEAERDRFQAASVDPADLAGLRTTAGELAALEEEIAREELQAAHLRRQLADVTYEARGGQPGMPGGIFAAGRGGSTFPNYAAVRSRATLTQQLEQQLRQVARARERFRQHRAQASLAFPLLSQDVSFAEISRASPEMIERIIGVHVDRILDNIADTEENIRDRRLKVWDLRSIFEMTCQDLNVSPDSALMGAVMDHVRREERDESIWKLAVAAIGLTAAIIAALPTAGASLAVAGTIIAVGAGAYQLSESVQDFMAESAAEDVSLDASLADIAVSDPEWWPVALDIVGLGLDAFDVIRIVGLLKQTVRATRATDSAASFARGFDEIAQIVARETGSEAAAARVVASIARRADIEATMVRLVEGYAGRFARADMDDVAAEIARLADPAVDAAVTELRAQGRVFELSEEGLEAGFGNLDVVAQYIQAGVLRWNGFFDPATGKIFVKPGAMDEVASTLVHETVHYMQSIYRPMMTRFAEEFESHVAQRAFLQRLVADGIDPDVAFPAHKWLLDATDDDVVAFLRTTYGLHPVADLDVHAAVMDALTGLGRIDASDAASVGGDVMASRPFQTLDEMDDVIESSAGQYLRQGEDFDQVVTAGQAGLRAGVDYFDVSADAAFVLSRLSNADSTVGPLIGRLLDEGLVTEGSLTTFVREWIGRRRLPYFAMADLRRAIRHEYHDAFVRHFVDAGDPAGAHRRFVEATSNLHFADRGELAERWYRAMHLPEDVLSQQVIDAVALGERLGTGRGLTAVRRPDFMSGSTAVEVKSHVGRLGQESMAQIDEYLYAAQHAATVTTRDGAQLAMDNVQVVLLRPTAVRSNAEVLGAWFDAHPGRFEAVVFDTAGNRHVLRSRGELDAFMGG